MNVLRTFLFKVLWSWKGVGVMELHLNYEKKGEILICLLLCRVGKSSLKVVKA
jgi:hypothetical protein